MQLRHMRFYAQKSKPRLTSDTQ